MSCITIIPVIIPNIPVITVIVPVIIPVIIPVSLVYNPTSIACTCFFSCSAPRLNVKEARAAEPGRCLAPNKYSRWYTIVIFLHKAKS